MYRVCQTKDGKLIEMQGGGESADKELEAMRLKTLKQNALNAGYKEDEIEVRWVTDQEWQVIIAEANKRTPEQEAEIETEKIIQAKIREQAIVALKAEGKLDSAGKTKGK